MENFILVPIDFSSICQIAIQQSQNLALLTDSTLALVHVNQSDKSDDKVQEEILSFAKAAGLKDGVKVKTFVEHGRVVNGILRVNEKVDPIFVVVGFNTKHGFFERVGSNTRTLVSKAKRPVITIKGTSHRDGCKTIVLPVDLTKTTRQKVAHAIRFAKLFNSEIKVAVIHEEETKRDAATLKVYERQVTERFEQNNIPYTVHHLEGKEIAKTVLKFSNEVDADLVIIMTQQETGLKDLFVGSVAQNFINLSEIPVLSITPKDSGITSWKS